MRWPWVSRERLDESERFWCCLLEEHRARMDRVLLDTSRYVAQICELTRENERLKKEKLEPK